MVSPNNNCPTKLYISFEENRCCRQFRVEWKNKKKSEGMIN